MEEKVLKLGGGETTTIDLTLEKMVTERYQVTSYKTKYVNGKSAGNINVGWSVSLDNPADYLLEEASDSFQITPTSSNCSTVCTVKQNESANTYIINVTTPSDLIENDILVTLRTDDVSGSSANLEVSARYEVTSDIDFYVTIKYGVSSNDFRTENLTLNSGDSYTAQVVYIQEGVIPTILQGDYSPKEDSKYKYIVNFM